MNIRLKQIARTIARAIWEDYLATFAAGEVNKHCRGRRRFIDEDQDALGARGNA
jgi:hypothetical protein